MGVDLLSHYGFDLHLFIDFEQLYTCLLAIHMFSLEKSLLKSFAHFLIEQFFLLFLVVKFLYIF